jgi:hypothetical protein
MSIDLDRFSAPLHREEIYIDEYRYDEEYREQDEEYIAESRDRFDHLINTY